MTRNFGFSSLLSVVVIAIIMLFAIPLMGEQVDKAKQFMASQESGPYTGSGIVTDASTAGGTCSVEIIASTELVTATAPSCTGIALGDTVQVVNNVIR